MWIETFVMPPEESGPYLPSSVRDRAKRHAIQVQESQSLRDSLLGFVREHQLSDAVKWVSEPGPLPIIRFHCTDGALAMLRQAVDFVVGQAAPVEAYPALVGTEPPLHAVPEALLASEPLLEPRL